MTQAATQTGQEDTERKWTRIPVYAHKGDVRYFKGLIGQCIRRSLGVRKWNTGPQDVRYYSIAQAKADHYEDPFFEAYLTDAEATTLTEALREEVDRGAWDLWVQ